MGSPASPARGAQSACPRHLSLMGNYPRVTTNARSLGSEWTLGSGGLGQRFEGDVVAERLQAGDEAFGESFGVAALVVVAAEFAVGFAGGEHVPVGDEHRVLDGAECAAVPDAWFEALVLGLEVAVLGSGGGQRGFLERDPEELAAFASASGVAFAGGLVVAGAACGPGGEVPGAGEHAHVGADLGDHRLGGALSDAGDRGG